MLTQIQIEIYAHHAHMRHTERERGRQTSKQDAVEARRLLLFATEASLGTRPSSSSAHHQARPQSTTKTEVKTMKANQRKSTQGLSDRERAFKSQAWQFCMGNRRGWSWCFEWCIIEWGPGARERESDSGAIHRDSFKCLWNSLGFELSSTGNCAFDVPTSSVFLIGAFSASTS